MANKIKYSSERCIYHGVSDMSIKSNCKYVICRRDKDTNIESYFAGFVNISEYEDDVVHDLIGTPIHPISVTCGLEDWDDDAEDAKYMQHTFKDYAECKAWFDVLNFDDRQFEYEIRLYCYSSYFKRQPLKTMYIRSV